MMRPGSYPEGDAPRETPHPMRRTFRILLLASLGLAIFLKATGPRLDGRGLAALSAEVGLALLIMSGTRSALFHILLAVYSTGLVVFQFFLHAPQSPCSCVGGAPTWVAPTLAGAIGLSSAFLLTDCIAERTSP